jgi:hypothetical protein
MRLFRSTVLIVQELAKSRTVENSTGHPSHNKLCSVLLDVEVMINGGLSRNEPLNSGKFYAKNHVYYMMLKFNLTN